MNKPKPRETQTGGRDATTRHIPPVLALAVGMPSTPPPSGWTWSPLTKLARLESGHTPSRSHPEYWGGSIPWISIQDAKANNGGRIHETLEYTNDLGIANSSARVLPENTVCLSRTASVGYVVVMGRPMATSQDFVNWVCTDELDPRFLQHLLLAEGENLLRFASGAVHPTIYFPEAKAFHVCHPPPSEQRRIVGILDEAFAGIAAARANAERNLQNARAVFESYREAVFTCEGSGLVRRRLGDVCTLQRGFDLPTHSRVQGRFPLVSSSGIIDSHNQGPVKGPGVVTGRSGSVGGVFYIVEDFWPLNTVLYVKDFHGNDPKFVYRLLTQFRLERFATGAGVPTLNRNFVHDEMVNIPSSPAEQSIIASRLESLEAESLRLESLYRGKLAALDELKKSLLHRAFSGEL